MTMIRSIALAAVLGALVAAGTLYAAAQPAVAERHCDLARRRPSGRPARSSRSEEWPICTTMAAIGSEVRLGPARSGFRRRQEGARRRGLECGAIAALKLAALRDPRNADIQNYIGYAYRRLRQLGPAMGHYQQALMFNPRHRSAHEHLGELYLVLREPAQGGRAPRRT